MDARNKIKLLITCMLILPPLLFARQLDKNTSLSKSSTAEPTNSAGIHLEQTSRNNSFDCPKPTDLIYSQMHVWLESLNIDIKDKKSQKVNSTAQSLHVFTEQGIAAPTANVMAKLKATLSSETLPFLSDIFKASALPKKITFIQTHKIKVKALFCENFQEKDNFVILVEPNFLATQVSLFDIFVHEYTHYYFHIHKFEAPLWYEEGTSLLVEYLYNNIASTNVVNQHLVESDVSLTQGFSNFRTASSAYGHAQLLFTYLYNKLGDAFIDEILTRNNGNEKTLNDFIQKIAKELPDSLPWNTFSDAFVTLQIAKRINRDDYAHTRSSVLRQKYFIFNSKLHAKDYLDDRPLMYNNSLAPWSSTAFSDINAVSLEIIKKYECFVVVNPRYSKLTLIPCIEAEGDLLRPSSNHFYILIRKD
jgi:hypothetical protein